MMKYIFCIMIGLFLVSGSHPIPDQELQTFRSEAGTVGLPSSASSTYHVPQAVIQQLSKANSSVKVGTFSCKMSDIVLGNSFSSRNLPPAKILRCNAASHVTQKLSSFKPPLPEVRWSGKIFDTPLCKYSNRYYVYTLGRILI